MGEINYEQLGIAVRDQVIETYQAESVLSLFASEDIPGGIATEKWALKYIKETIRAAWTQRGFNPNEIDIDFEGYKLEPTTIAQEMVLGEIKQAFFAQHGFLELGKNSLGSNMAYTSNTAFLLGKGGNAETSPLPGQYNFLYDVGTGDGTAVRPLSPYAAAATGTWNTFANMDTDLANLVGAMVSAGYDKGDLIIMYPKCAEALMMRRVSGYDNLTIAQHLKLSGVKDVIALNNEFMTTAAAGVPVITAFDIWVFALSSIVVGYERREVVTSGKGQFPDRSYYVQGEVWPCPVFIPNRRNVAGTIITYKGFGRVQAITNAA